MPEEKSSTVKQIIIGVVVAVVSAVVLARLGLQESTKVPTNPGSGTSSPQPSTSSPVRSSETTRVDLAGTWRAEGDYLGTPTEYVWRADDDGSCSLTMSNAVAQFPPLGCSWTHSGNVVEEHFTSGLSVRLSLRVVSKDQVEITVTDSNDPSTALGTRLMYFRM